MNTILFSKKIGTHGLIIALLSGTILSAPGTAQEALPTGGKVVSGQASISTSEGTLTVDQKSDKLIADWKSFSIGKDNSVIFNQPNSRSVALNRVIGQDPSLILGSLIANGTVFLVNPNGIVIGKDGSVQAGGFVGSTLGIKNSDFRKGNYTFKGSDGAILNQGDLKGGIIALIAPIVQNDGSIVGSAALAGGTDVTLDFDGDGLIGVEVAASTVGTLVENRGLIKADGGLVFLTAKGANDALRGIVNNGGVIEASSLESRDGRILLLGDMKHGTVNAAGTLEAPFVETSAARVNIADGVQVKTNGGNWLIDPNDFTIAASGGNITGVTLSNNLANGNVTITTATQGTTGGNGDIFVNDGVTWSANKLTLNADRNININTAMNASGTAGLALEYAQTVATGSYYVNAPVNLASTGSFSTKKGGAAAINYTIINSLGAAGSTTGTDLQGISGNLSANYVLGSDLDASATGNWNGGAGFDPIGNGTDENGAIVEKGFVGTFDGLGHVVRNLVINRPTEDYIGLFGYANPEFQFETPGIRNIGLENINVVGRRKVGGLVGIFFNGYITKAYTTGTVKGSDEDFVADTNVSAQTGTGGLIGYAHYAKISSSFSSANVQGGFDVGGLIGRLYRGPSENSFFTTLTDSYATGNVIGRRSAGGLVGAAGNIAIKNSYATGNVKASEFQAGGLVGSATGEFSNVYATGAVSGISAGGLIGAAGNLTLSESFATGDVSSNDITLVLAPNPEPVFFSARAGGLIGQLQGNSSINNSYATGQVTVTGDASVAGSPNEFRGEGIFAGGLVGITQGDGNSISNSYATGKITHPGGNSIIGGLVGRALVSKVPLAGQTLNIVGSFYDAETTGATAGCGFVGINVTCNATGLTTVQMKNAASFTAASWDFNTIWAIDPAINNGYPYLRATVAAPVVAPPPAPPPPPPPAPVLAVNDFGTSFSTTAAPYQPTIALTGSGFNAVTEIRFTYTGPNGQSGTIIWNAANQFGGGRFVIANDGSATISPVLVAANDPSGSYQWTITFVAGSQSIARNFGVTYTAVVVPPPPSPPPPPPTAVEPPVVTLPPSTTATPLQTPVLNGSQQFPRAGLQFGTETAPPLYVSTGPYLSGQTTALLAAIAASDISPALKALITEAIQDYGSINNFGLIADNVSYALLSNAVYGKSGSDPSSSGWQTLDADFAGLLSNIFGFSASVYRNTSTGETVIAFAGTNQWQDWVSTNFTLGVGQEGAALQLFNAVAASCKCSVTLTGHSLGGGLAQVVASLTGSKAITFDPAPFVSTGTKLTTSDANIISFRNNSDPLTALFGWASSGTMTTVKNTADYPGVFPELNHSMENLLIAMQAIALYTKTLKNKSLIR